MDPKIAKYPEQKWKNLAVQLIIKPRRNGSRPCLSARWSKLSVSGVKIVREVVKNVRENIPTWRNDLLYATADPESE